jgi:TetR/AcrR family transcriptional repressor of nem operon
MAGADLTIGGFYAHFSSKEAMDAELIRCVLGDLPGRWLAGLEESSGLDWLARAVKRYLDKSHRDNPDGCAYPAVISEVIRSGDNVRRAFAESFDRRVRAFSAHAPDSPTISKRDRALATLALTLGALVLARATRGAAISDEVLVASRKWALPEENERPSGQRSGRARRRSR